jgi:hypothetical protein
LHTKSKQSAKGPEDESQGKREAMGSASPLVRENSAPKARNMKARGKRGASPLVRENSAKGAEYESQGQARSEAERVAPGKRE